MAQGYRFSVFARKSSDLFFLESYDGVTVYRYDTLLHEIIDEVPDHSGAVVVDMSWNGVFGTEKNSDFQVTFNIPQIIASVKLAKKINAKHWIGFGSQAEYGSINERVDESHPCNPITLYGKSKVLCSQISALLCKNYAIEYTWLRLFSAYGPYGNHQWFVDYLIEEMRNNRTINATRCEQYLDYLYVDDITNLLVTLGKKGGVGIANLGSGKALQLKNIMEKIKTLVGSTSQINYGVIDYKKDQGMFNEADITKISNLTGWAPKISVEEGFYDMIKKNND